MLLKHVWRHKQHVQRVSECTQTYFSVLYVSAGPKLALLTIYNKGGFFFARKIQKPNKYLVRKKSRKKGEMR